MKTRMNSNSLEFEFPSGLSYFFEQIGVYGDTSMVSQVEQILGIDLSLFQNTYNYDMEDEDEFDDDYDDGDSESTWLKVNDIQGVIRTFLAKISENPYYHKHVKYKGMLYPEDTGYLSRGEIVGDLNALDATLNKLKATDCLEIRLVYA